MTMTSVQSPRSLVLRWSVRCYPVLSVHLAEIMMCIFCRDHQIFAAVANHSYIKEAVSRIFWAYLLSCVLQNCNDIKSSSMLGVPRSDQRTTLPKDVLMCRCYIERPAVPHSCRILKGTAEKAIDKYVSRIGSVSLGSHALRRASTYYAIRHALYVLRSLSTAIAIRRGFR